MASKLYPTLSSFYKAGNVGFGSELDAMLCGVPEEKLYRKPSRQRKELPLQISNTHSQLEAPQPAIDRADSLEFNRDPQFLPLSQDHREDESVTPPLSPSAPPLLEMLDMRLQQYLNVLLDTNDNSNIALPSEDNQTLFPPSTSNIDPDNGSDHTTVTLPLPPNVEVEESWLDEIRPDYDDFSTEEMADEILNNLNVVRDEDAKDHEKQKSLSLLKTPKDSQGRAFREEEERQKVQPHSQHQHMDHRHGHSHQRQTSQHSGDDNADIKNDQIPHDHHQQQHHHHRHHHHHRKSNGATRLQERESKNRGDIRLAGKAKRQESAERPPLGPNNESAGRDRRRDAYPHRVSNHVIRARHENGMSTTDLVEGQLESSRPIARRKSSSAEKENHHGSPGRADVHGEKADYNAWMTWRKQVDS